MKDSKRMFDRISVLINKARRNVAFKLNQEMVLLYWNIGKLIKTEIIKSKRAQYGKRILHALSGELTLKYGKGYSEQNLWYMIQFYETYPILQPLVGELKSLSWTHIVILLPIKDKLKRQFYSLLCRNEQWSKRTLQERINSMLYERTTLSRLPAKMIKKELKSLREKDKISPNLVFRDPYVLDFLELNETYQEKDFEKAILIRLEKFIIEFGRDFYFVARQKRITVDNEDHYIDLLFYHKELKCHIIIELKLGKFKPEHKGQMELYLRYIEKYEMGKDDNPPIGLILCAEKGREKIELMFLPKDRIKVSEYITKLPSKKLFEEKLQKAVASANLGINAIDR